MEALEFLKEYNRLRKSLSDCDECPLEICIQDNNNNEDDLKKIIQGVEQWSKEHPKKTYKDVFLEVFQNAILDDDGTPIVCTKSIFGKENIDCVQDEGRMDFENCAECWNQEYKEDEQ